jgi:hypothetical protein
MGYKLLHNSNIWEIPESHGTPVVKTCDANQAESFLILMMQVTVTTIISAFVIT